MEATSSSEKCGRPHRASWGKSCARRGRCLRGWSAQSGRRSSWQRPFPDRASGSKLRSSPARPGIGSTCPASSMPGRLGAPCVFQSFGEWQTSQPTNPHDQIAAAGQALGSAFELAAGGGPGPGADERAPPDGESDRRREQQAKYQQNLSQCLHPSPEVRNCGLLKNIHITKL